MYLILYIYIYKLKIHVLFRSFVCNTKRPSVKQSIKQQVSSNLADEPSLADAPHTRAEMSWIPVQKTWHMNLLWPMDPPVPEQRCLEYQNTKLGRWTYFGQWTPQYQSRDALNTSTQNLADEPTLANGPHLYQSRDALNTSTQNLADEPTLANGSPGNRAGMTWIPVHKTWQMNLLWPMDPPYQSRDALNARAQNLADEPTLANGPPSTRAQMPSIPVHKTWQMNLLWPMDPTCTRAEMPWIPEHKTWQMNLLWPMDPPVPEQRCLEYQYTKLGRWTYFGQWTPPVPEQRCLEYQYTKLGRWTYFGQWIPG